MQEELDNARSFGRPREVQPCTGSNWFFKRIASVRACPKRVEPHFEPGATEAHLADGERRIGVTLPADLRSLLAECDGVMGRMEIQGEAIDIELLIWPTDTIGERNLDPGRADLRVPETWLTFATADGNDFGYDLHAGDGRIWMWHPIDDESECVATSLADYLVRRIVGGPRS